MAPAMAQDTGEVIEEITVTGIRKSQMDAVNLKRDSNSIVDGIAATDLGKLPDVTVADSLQRIPGIQIQRNAGEGATVNIRGLPPVSYTHLTLPTMSTTCRSRWSPYD